MSVIACGCGMVAHECVVCGHPFKVVKPPWHKISPKDKGTWPDEGEAVWGVRRDRGNVEYEGYWAKGDVKRYSHWKQADPPQYPAE